MEYAARAPGGQTPERAGDPLGAASSQRQSTDSQLAQRAGDEEFLARHQLPASATRSSVSVTGRDLRRALSPLRLAGRSMEPFRQKIPAEPWITSCSLLTSGVRPQSEPLWVRFVEIALQLPVK